MQMGRQPQIHANSLAFGSGLATLCVIGSATQRRAFVWNATSKGIARHVAALMRVGL